MTKPKKVTWSAKKIKIVQHKISKQEGKQLLTEIAEILYDLACQLQHNQNKNQNFQNSNALSKTNEDAA